jgi:hypothetical protein
MLEIVALEPATQDSSEPSTAEWSTHNRLVLLGSVIAGLAIVAVIVLNIQRPVSRFSGIDPYQIWRSAQSLYPAKAWDVWQEMKKGLDRRTDDQYAAAIVRFHIWEAMVGGVALFGVALIAAGTILGKRRSGAAFHEPPPLSS